MTGANWSDVRRVLCIRLDSIGDVLMTTPAINAIRHGGHVEHVTLLTSPAGAQVAAMIPDVDAVIAYEAPWMKAGEDHAADDDRRMIARLAADRFDAAVIFTVFSQTPFPAAMLAYLAGIPRILAHCRERSYHLVSDAVAETEPERGIRHEVRRQLDLVATIGFTTRDERLRIAIPPAAGEAIATLIPDAGPWAVVHAGSTAPSRRYPPESFAEIIRALVLTHGWRIAMTGDADEADLVHAIARQTGVAVLDLAGRLDLPQLAALIDAAPVLIANNSGPAHIAAATQTPVVDLYALTNPQHTPWMVPHRVLSHNVPCRWCYASVCKTGHHLCLRAIEPAEVVAAARALAGGAADVENARRSSAVVHALDTRNEGIPFPTSGAAPRPV